MLELLRKNFPYALTLMFGLLVFLPLGWYLHAQFQSQSDSSLLSPFISQDSKKELPLLRYSIPNLSKRTYQPSRIVIEEELATTDAYKSFLFSYQTLDRKMTGQLNVPTQFLKLNQAHSSAPVVIMLRGYVPLEIYETGVGTRNAAKVLAENGFVTIAPDFFGYGGSDPEPTDSWQARFEKPIAVIELIETLKAQPLTVPVAPDEATTVTIAMTKYGLWAHSNGGQIALTTLEVLAQPIPTTLWAPVTAPFPYSILFFSDESEDEGKGMRKWLTQFEKDYDVFDFTLTKHLDRLNGPLQLHHGTADEAALEVWSDEFEDKIKAENKRRELLVEDMTASESAQLSSQEKLALEPIELSYFTYPGANHNLQPGWDTVVARDVAFFTKHLK